MMRTREDIEALEAQILAPYAMKSRDSEGRKYDASQHPVRTCYQRDRDRVVHSEAFRKLEYKTQVFVILEGDYYRTRLTHTIEVAQIARTIGRSLRLNEDLIEAVALAHDLGHPPFGHAGEYALSRIMGQAGFPGFNHNFRSYEIVTKYEKKYPTFEGLDLSSEVVVGILKHETNYDISSDVPEYKDKGPTLEARVVDIADALAYLSHDIDDGLTSGLITHHDLMESQLWSESYKKVNSILSAENREMWKYQIVKFLIDCQTKDLLEYSAQNLRKFDFTSSDEVKAYHQKKKQEVIISFSPQMKAQRDELQALLHDKLYKHYRVVRMTEKAGRIIEEISHVYQSNPNQLPYGVYGREEFYKVADKSGNKIKPSKRTVETICNYIAGMTDRFALDEHKKLFNPYQKV